MGKASKLDLILEMETISPVIEALPRHQVQLIVDTFLQAVTTGLHLKKKIELRGFGSFSVRPTAARMGRNPATGEAVEIAPGYKVSFKAHAALKDAIKANEEID